MSTPSIDLCASPAGKSDTPGCHPITVTAIACRPIALSAASHQVHTCDEAMCPAPMDSPPEATFRGDRVSRSALEVVADIAANPVNSLTCFRKNAPLRRGVFGFGPDKGKICHFLHKDCLRKGHFEFKNAPLRAETSSVLAPVARVAELVDAQD